MTNLNNKLIKFLDGLYSGFLYLEKEKDLSDLDDVDKKIYVRYIENIKEDIISKRDQLKDL